MTLISIIFAIDAAIAPHPDMPCHAYLITDTPPLPCHYFLRLRHYAATTP